MPVGTEVDLVLGTYSAVSQLSVSLLPGLLAAQPARESAPPVLLARCKSDLIQGGGGRAEGGAPPDNIARLEDGTLSAMWSLDTSAKTGQGIIPLLRALAAMVLEAQALAYEQWAHRRGDHLAGVRSRLVSLEADLNEPKQILDAPPRELVGDRLNASNREWEYRIDKALETQGKKLGNESFKKKVLENTADALGEIGEFLQMDGGFSEENYLMGMIDEAWDEAQRTYEWNKLKGILEKEKYNYELAKFALLGAAQGQSNSFPGMVDGVHASHWVASGAVSRACQKMRVNSAYGEVALNSRVRALNSQERNIREGPGAWEQKEEDMRHGEVAEVLARESKMSNHPRMSVRDRMKAVREVSTGLAAQPAHSSERLMGPPASIDGEHRLRGFVRDQFYTSHAQEQNKGSLGTLPLPALIRRLDVPVPLILNAQEVHRIPKCFYRS